MGMIRENHIGGIPELKALSMSEALVIDGCKGTPAGKLV